MELVYLWVEEYKNIKRQGFNFSHRFECEFRAEYDEHRKLKDDCELIINEKENYKSIFPKNINITAIVGENGSGKSNLIEIISLLRFEKKLSKVLLIYQNKNDLLIFSKSKRMMHVFSSFKIKIINKTKLNSKNQDIDSDELFNLTLFNTRLSDFTIQKSSYEQLKSNHYDGYYNGLTMKYSNDLSSNSEYLEVNSKLFYLLSEKSDFLDFIDKKLIFDKFRYELDFKDKFSYSIDTNYKTRLKNINLGYFSDHIGISYNMGEYDKIYSKDGYNPVYVEARKYNLIYSYMVFYFLDRVFSMIEHFARDIDKDIINKIVEKELMADLESQYKMWKDTKEDLDVIASFYYEIVYFGMVLLSLKIFIKQFKNYILQFQDVIRKKEENPNISYLEEDYLHYYAEIKYINHFKLFAKIINNNFEYANFNDNTLLLKSKLLNFNDKNKKYKSSIVLDRKGILNHNFVNSEYDYNYNLLSGGEKQYIKFFTNIFYTLYKQSEYEKSQVVFLDEVDLSFHPNWQKKLLKNITNVILKINKCRKIKISYHLIYITHSPFILSDLPKENVIFLENGEQVDPFKNKQTFGSNIHTLLSHGFFMSDGLIGELAKEKIQNVIQFLNDEDSDLEKKDIFPIIELIGEPFLKHKLKEKYYEKYPQERNIDNEITELKKKLEELENVKNSN